MDASRDVAQLLLHAGAVSLRPDEPFTYASGIRSPIYCDNRSLLGMPAQRERVIEAFLAILATLECDIVAGTATAGIPWAAWLAREKGLPMAYVRSKPKGYGKERRIEGADVRGRRVVIVDDLISTGGSALSAIAAVREEGGVATDCLAIFSYGLRASRDGFAHAGCALHALTDLRELLSAARGQALIDPAQQSAIEAWQRDPEAWPGARDA